MLGWTGDNGDPDNFLCYFFCSPGASREGFYSNQALADVLMRVQVLHERRPVGVPVPGRGDHAIGARLQNVLGDGLRDALDPRLGGS